VASRKRWRRGAVIRKRLGRAHHYARLLEFPWVAFYRATTARASDDLVAIVASDVRFTIAAHKDLLANTEWDVIGTVALDGALRPPRAQAIWDDAEHCHIIDDAGEMRPATPAECADLEPAAVWEPEHISDRLRDALAGRPNKWLEQLRPSPRTIPRRRARQR
jgi:hypothetical protein